MEGSKRFKKIDISYAGVLEAIESNRTPLMVFFSSLFLFLTFAGTRLFFSDEGVILDQFYNLINGSLAIKAAKIDTLEGVFILVGNNLYAKFSYSPLILSLPAYHILRIMDYLYDAHLFILQLWAVSGAIIVFLILRARRWRYAIHGGLISYFFLLGVNLYSFKPIYFPKWGELLSIELTNILISSLLVLIIFYMFKRIFNDKIAVFASFFVILATPIPFYAITLKHHSLALLFTVLAFYFFYNYIDKKEDKFILLAYVSSGLCIWTRILDGAVLLSSLAVIDIFFLRRGVRQMFHTLIIISISLFPFFLFNYLMLGNPVSIIENVPLTTEQVSLSKAKDFITLQGGPEINQSELLNDMGYTWNANIRGDWTDLLKYSLLMKLINTHGIFLVSPFLIAALAFLIVIIDWRQTRLNAMDKLLGIYTLLLFVVYRDFIFSIISDTPMVLEYRYFLIFYIIFLYFSLRIDKVRELMENDIKKIAILYISLLIAMVIYFIKEFPVPFIGFYHNLSLATAISLIALLSIGLIIKGKLPVPLNKLTVFVIALSLAEATFFLIFYYWIVSMTYISPSQNYSVVPVAGNLLQMMYPIIR